VPGRKPPARPVTLRVAGGSKTIDLTLDDFVALKAMAAGELEVKACKPFVRLRGLGLATHRFSGDAWPRALAELTALGRQALTQEFAPA
jgi:hypothetical protein